jgi:hypothetical protein
MDPPKAQALKGRFSYFHPLPCPNSQKEKVYENTESRTSNLNFEDRICEVEDVRGREGRFGLDGNGFAWVRHESKLGVEELRDGEGIEVYLGEVEGLVRDVLEAGDGDGGEGRRNNERVVRVFSWKVNKSILYLIKYQINSDRICS